MPFRKESDVYVLVGTLRVSSPIPGSRYLPKFTKHWAILVDGFCFELKKRKHEDRDRIRGLPFYEWRKVNQEWDKKPIKVGITTMDWEDIVLEAFWIWTLRFEETYKVSTQNCQNFAYLLGERITVDKDQLIRDGRQTEIQSHKPFPRSFSRLNRCLKLLGPMYMTLGKDGDEEYLKMRKRLEAIGFDAGKRRIWEVRQRILRALKGKADPAEKVAILDQFEGAHARLTERDFKAIYRYTGDWNFSAEHDSDHDSGYGSGNNSEDDPRERMAKPSKHPVRNTTHEIQLSLVKTRPIDHTKRRKERSYYEAREDNLCTPLRRFNEMGNGMIKLANKSSNGSRRR